MDSSLTPQQQALRQQQEALRQQMRSTQRGSEAYRELVRQYGALHDQLTRLLEKPQQEQRAAYYASAEKRYIAPDPSQQARWDRMAEAFMQEPESILARKVEQSTARFRSLHRQNTAVNREPDWVRVEGQRNVSRRTAETRTSRDLARTPVKLPAIVPSLPEQPDWTPEQNQAMARLKTRMEQIMRVSGGQDLITTALQDQELNQLLRDRHMPIEVLTHFANLVQRNQQLGVSPTRTIEQMRAAAGQQPTTYLSEDELNMPTRAEYLFQNRIARRQIQARYQKIASGLGVSVSRLRKALPNLSYEQERYMQELERNPQGFLHAGPGTGKTEALVWSALNAVASGKIKIHELAMTAATNTAKEALVDRFSRVASLFPNWDFERAKRVQFRTTHAMALSDLRRKTVRVENPDEPGTYMRITPMQAMGRGHWQLLGQENHEQGKKDSRFRGPDLDAVAANAENEQITYFRSMLDLYNIRNIGQSHRSIIQSINETKSNHRNAKAYQDRFERGKQQIKRGNFKDTDALFYLYEVNLHQSEGHAENEKQQTPLYDWNDVLHYWNWSNAQGYTRKRKGILADEVQDNSFDMTYGQASNLRPGGLYMAGGDLGQRFMSGSRRVTDVMRKAFPAMFTAMLTGNYRSSREVVAGNNMGNQSQVMQEAGTGPFQVAVGRFAKAGEMPEYTYASTFAQVHKMAIQDWFAKIGLSMEQLQRNMAEGKYPLEGAALPARSVPIVFQMHEERTLFQKALFNELKKHLGAETAQYAISQFLHNPEHTQNFGDVAHANMMHLPTVQQIKGWGTDYVFAMMTREGAWNQAGYEQNMNIMRSRAIYGVHYYGAGQNLGSWNQYNNEPDYVDQWQRPVPHGVAAQLPLFLQNLHQHQGMSTSEIPGEFQPFLHEALPQEMPQMNAVERAGLGQLIDVFAELQRYAKTPTDASTSGLLTTENGKLEFGEDEDGRLQMPGFSTEFNANGLMARNEQHINMTALNYASRTLDQLAQGHAINGFGQESLPASITEFMDALDPMIGRVKEPALDTDFPASSVFESDNKNGFPPDRRKPELFEREEDQQYLRGSIRRFLSMSATQSYPEIQALFQEQMANPKVLGFVKSEAEKFGIKQVFPTEQKRMMDLLTRQVMQPSDNASIEQVHPALPQLIAEQMLSNNPRSEREVRGLIRGLLWTKDKGDPTAKRYRALARSEVRRTDVTDKAAIVQGFLTATSKREQSLGRRVRQRIIAQLGGGSLPTDMITTLHDVSSQMLTGDMLPKTRAKLEVFQQVLESHYGTPVDHTKGIQLSHQDLEDIRARNPMEAAMIEQLMGKIGEDEWGRLRQQNAETAKHLSKRFGVFGKDDVLDVQDLFTASEQYPYKQSGLLRSARGKNLGVSIGQQHIAPAVAQLRSMAYNLERIGIVDPQARAQARLFDHEGNEVINGVNVPLGLAVGLESYERRMRDMLAGSGLTFGQAAHYEQQLAQVQSLRAAVHNPENQQNWAHALNAVMRAAYGKGSFFEPGQSNREFEMLFSKRQFKGGQPYSLETLQEYLGALQTMSLHMQRSGMIQRGHVNRVLAALGHDPNDRMFVGLHDEEMQRHFGESTATLSLTDLAQMFPSTKNNAFAELTRAPFQEGTRQYAFMGGAEGFAPISKGWRPAAQVHHNRRERQYGMPVRPQSALKTGALGTLHRWNPEEGFGLSKFKSFHINENLLTPDELKMLNQQQKYEVGKDGVRRLVPDKDASFEPLYLFQEAGTNVLNPVRAGQIADPALLSDAMRQQYGIPATERGETVFSPQFGVSLSDSWLSPEWTKERAGRTPEQQAQVQETVAMMQRLQPPIEKDQLTTFSKALDTQKPTHGLSQRIWNWIRENRKNTSPEYLQQTADTNRKWFTTSRTILAEPVRHAFGWRYKGLDASERVKLLAAPASPPPPPPTPPTALAAPAPEPERRSGPVLSSRGFIRDLSAPLPGRVILPPQGTRPPSRFRRLNGNRMRFDANGQLILATRPERRYAGFLPATSMPMPPDIPSPAPIAPPPPLAPAQAMPPALPLSAPPLPSYAQAIALQPSMPSAAVLPEVLPPGDLFSADLFEDEMAEPPEPLTLQEHMQNIGMAVLSGHGNIPRPSAAQREIIESQDPHLMLIGGPGSGKTETMVGRIMHQVANTGTLLPEEILPLSAMHSGVNALNQKLQKYRDLLPEEDAYVIPEARSFHSLAHAILAPAYDEFHEQMRSPLLEQMGVKFTGKIIADPKPEELAMLSPAEREEKLRNGATGFLGGVLAQYGQGMGMGTPSMGQVDEIMQHINAVKGGRTDDANDPYTASYVRGKKELERAAYLRQHQQAIPALSGDAGLVLYEEQKAHEGIFDHPDQLWHAGNILQAYGEAGIPDRFRGIRQLVIDEGQDISHPALRMLRSFFGALRSRGNNPRLMVGGDYMQSSLSEGLGGVNPNEMEQTYQSMVQEPVRTRTLTENWRSDRGIVALTNAILAHPALHGLKRVIQQSPAAITSAGRAPLIGLARSQPALYDLMLEHMLHTAGLSWQRIGNNLANGRHPMAQRAGQLLPKEIPAVITRHNDRRLFLAQTLTRIQKELGVSRRQAYQIRNQMFRTNIPILNSKGTNRDEVEYAKHQFPVLTQAQIRSFDVAAPHLDVTNVGGGTIQDYLRRLLIGVSRVSQGGRAHLFATDRPFNRHQVNTYLSNPALLSDTATPGDLFGGSVYLDRQEVKRDDRNTFEQYQGAYVPHGLGEIFARAQGSMRDAGVSPDDPFFTGEASDFVPPAFAPAAPVASPGLAPSILAHMALSQHPQGSGVVPGVAMPSDSGTMPPDLRSMPPLLFPKRTLGRRIRWAADDVRDWAGRGARWVGRAIQRIPLNPLMAGMGEFVDPDDEELPPGPQPRPLPPPPDLESADYWNDWITRTTEGDKSFLGRFGHSIQMPNAVDRHGLITEMQNYVKGAASTFHVQSRVNPGLTPRHYIYGHGGLLDQNEANWQQQRDRIMGTLEAQYDQQPDPKILRAMNTLSEHGLTGADYLRTSLPTKARSHALTQLGIYPDLLTHLAGTSGAAQTPPLVASPPALTEPLQTAAPPPRVTHPADQATQRPPVAVPPDVAGINTINMANSHIQMSGNQMSVSITPSVGSQLGTGLAGAPGAWGQQNVPAPAHTPQATPPPPPRAQAQATSGNFYGNQSYQGQHAPSAGWATGSSSGTGTPTTGTGTGAGSGKQQQGVMGALFNMLGVRPNFGYGNADIQLGRTLARIGDELQFVGSNMQKQADSSIQQGSEYRHATLQILQKPSNASGLPESAAGSTGTEGYFNFSKAPAAVNPTIGGINTFAQQFSMFSEADIVKTMQQYLASTNQYFDVTKTPQATGDILAVSAMANMDPSQIMQYLTTATGFNQGGQNQDDQIAHLVGMMFKSLKGNLSEQNVAPYLSAIDQMVPLIEGTTSSAMKAPNGQTIDSSTQAAALLQMAIDAGVNPANFGTVAAATSTLAQAGYNPDERQQYQLAQFYGAKNLTASPQYFQYQLNQSQQQEQLAGMQLQSNIFGGYTGPYGDTQDNGIFADTLKQFQSMGLSLPGYSTDGQGHSIMHPLSIQDVQIQADNAEIHLAETNFQQSAFQLAQNQATFAFQQNLLNQEYGPIGQDTSRQAYFNFERSQMAAGYNPLNADSATTFKPSTPFGLKNEEFYAGIENQRSMLVLDRSPLLADAKFQQQLKYLNEQENFYQRELQLQNDQRSFDRTWGQRSLDMQAQALGAQKQMLASEILMKEYDKAQAELQKKYLPEQTAFLQMLILNMSQWIQGQGPVNGQNKSPTDIVSSLMNVYSMEGTKGLEKSLKGLGLSADQQTVLERMIQNAKSKGETIAQLMNDIANSGDASLLGALGQQSQQGGYANQQQNAGNANANLQGGGTGQAWDNLVAAMQQDTSAAQQLQADIAGGSGLTKHIGDLTSAISPFLGGIAAIANVIGTIAGFAGGAGGAHTGGAGGTGSMVSLPSMHGVGGPPPAPGPAGDWRNLPATFFVNFLEKLTGYIQQKQHNPNYSHLGVLTPHVNADFHAKMAYGQHQGVDFEAAQGTPLSEFIGGEVTAAGFHEWGGEVDVLLPGGLTERYLHLSQIGVHPGQFIKRGDRIGLTGGGTVASGLGRWSSGAHSHIQYDYGDINHGGINPWPVFAAFHDFSLLPYYGVSQLQPGSNLRRFSEGGIATRPMVGYLGEGGVSEAVIPLTKLGSVLAQTAGTSTAISTAKTSPVVSVQTLVGTLQLHVHLAQTQMNDQEKDQLMTDVLDVLQTAINQLAGKLSG